MAKRKTSSRHWYRFHVGECPVCGRDRSYRVRIYGRKPGDPRRRYLQLADSFTYDGCLQ